MIRTMNKAACPTKGPASVTPTWRGILYFEAKSSLASIVSATELAFMLTTNWSKLSSSKTAHSRAAVSLRAALRDNSPFSRESWGRLQEFTPISF